MANSIWADGSQNKLNLQELSQGETTNYKKVLPERCCKNNERLPQEDNLRNNKYMSK